MDLGIGSSDGTSVGVGSSSSDGRRVGTSVSVSELIGESEFVFLAWRRVPFPEFFGRFDSVPFPDFLGRFASRQAASGISECSVAASLLLEFPSARFSNRRISECSVAAFEIGALILLRLAGVVALADEPAGLQHSSLHSSLILSSSIFVKHFFETIHDSAWQRA